MTNLALNTPRQFQGLDRRVMFPVSDVHLYVGAAVMEHTDGYARNVATALGDFLGFMAEEVDNSAGTAGDLEGTLVTSGDVWLTVASGGTWAATQVGATVYASDSNTFTITASTHPSIGIVKKIPAAAIGDASGKILVHFEGAADRSL